MPISLLKTLRFRIAFGVWWWSWIELQAIVLHRLNFSWKISFIDSIVSNILLAGTILLVAIPLQFYIPQKNRFTHILANCIVMSVVWLFLSRFLVLLILNEGAEYNQFFSQSLLIRGAMGFLVIGCMALISVLWYTIQDQQEIEKRKTEADRLSKEAELNTLRQQLQPHFLFNSLNSINALINAQPEKARTMIQQLSDFLRGTLKKDQNQWTSLEDELQHLELYLEIEKVRFGHRLSATVKNDTKDMQLPVMLLQPVVENAIKFGLYDTTDDINISIEAKNENNSLIVEVKNPFDPETSSPKKGTGFGLSSVKRRLYLLFARNDLVKTNAEGNMFITTIKIPQP